MVAPTGTSGGSAVVRWSAWRTVVEQFSVQICRDEGEGEEEDGWDRYQDPFFSATQYYSRDAKDVYPGPDRKSEYARQRHREGERERGGG